MADEHVPRGQQYAQGVVLGFLRLVVRCATPLRCAARVLELFGPAAGHDVIAPHWTTGRLWLLRLGLAALLRPKPIAADWVWMVDHSIQVGQTKCLVVLGIRLSDLPVRRALCHEDMELIALEPMKDSTKETVAVCLEDAVIRTGVPRVILGTERGRTSGGSDMPASWHRPSVRSSRRSWHSWCHPANAPRRDS